MFLRCQRRKKDGKTQECWSIVESRQRTDALGGSGGAVQVLDTLQYDALGRLVQYGVSGGTPGSPVSRSVSLQYNALGMLLAKSDVANLSYPAQGVVGGTQNRLVHAVQRAQGYHNADYGYDLQGSLNSASSSTATGKFAGVVYTSFNQPASLAGAVSAGGALAYAWQYDESQQRLKETRSRAGALERTTWYLHPNNQGGLGMEREIVSAATPIHSNRHYLSAAGMAIGVIVTRGPLPVLGTQTAPTPVASMTAVKLEYWHKDHLGSLVATSDHSGAVTARYAYDPSGKRRYTNASYDPFGALVVDFTTDTNRGTDRGFTGHEHLDDVGVIHMNGRIYDPLLGRFLQADPFGTTPNCGPSALSAAFSKASLPFTASFGDGLERAMAHAVIGGTGSVLGGGKFANGAMTGAFSYLFNYCMHNGCTPTESGNSRDRDGYGRGDFGGSRDGGARRHEGMDFITAPSEEIQAPIGGVVKRMLYPYAGDTRLTGVEIVNEAGQSAKIFYVNPLSVAIGMRVDAGDVIGYAQDLHVKYNQTMTNHVHVEIRVIGKIVNPYEFMRDGPR